MSLIKKRNIKNQIPQTLYFALSSYPALLAGQKNRDCPLAISLLPRPAQVSRLALPCCPTIERCRHPAVTPSRAAVELRHRCLTIAARPSSPSCVHPPSRAHPAVSPLPLARPRRPQRRPRLGRGGRRRRGAVQGAGARCRCGERTAEAARGGCVSKKWGKG